MTKIIIVYMYIFQQVKVGEQTATGAGPNKKTAKRNAAEAMLLQLGYKASTPVAESSAKVIISKKTEVYI